MKKISSYMVTSALVVNVIILIPICYALMTNAIWIEDGFGIMSPARGVLLAVYLSIALASLISLAKRDTKFVAALLVIQVVYKVISPFTVGSIENPVVITNLLVALFHSAALFTIWRGSRLEYK